MSRAGYTEDYDFDQWAHIRWRGAVASSIKGKRGQAFLRELADALDAMPEKRLIAGDLEREDNVCTIGSLGKVRGVDMAKLDPEDPGPIADAFGIAEPLVREIEYMNDEAGWYNETPEARWKRMRAWVEASIMKPAKAGVA
ncbi:hypothetical protein ACQKJZ_17600 [Sphingomonas sp. NPDC019816]|uniref:hypothetical protein n=1 Tax=Sphingomonas sp. NPDC019816 TaxID=3390679 RepID=UPI003CFE37B5